VQGFLGHVQGGDATSPSAVFLAEKATIGGDVLSAADGLAERFISIRRFLGQVSAVTGCAARRRGMEQADQNVPDDPRPVPAGTSATLTTSSGEGA